MNSYTGCEDQIISSYTKGRMKTIVFQWENIIILRRMSKAFYNAAELAKNIKMAMEKGP
ncbi:MAG: hypothetical protein KKD44_24650 [Proteobacteria bacterium]|nr:hypothetical protein [Pseudomonadota bacterium]